MHPVDSCLSVRGSHCQETNADQVADVAWRWRQPANVVWIVRSVATAATRGDRHWRCCRLFAAATAWSLTLGLVVSHGLLVFHVLPEMPGLPDYLPSFPVLLGLLGLPGLLVLFGLCLTLCRLLLLGLVQQLALLSLLALLRPLVLMNLLPMVQQEQATSTR